MHQQKYISLIVLILLFSLPASAQNGTVDWPHYQDMAVDLMQKYLRINTSNPPGNEIEAAVSSDVLLEFAQT